MPTIPVVKAIQTEIKKYKLELANKTLAPGFDNYNSHQKAKGTAEGLDIAARICEQMEKRYIEGDTDE